MIPDDHLLAYLSGALDREERKRFEARVAEDADALRRLVVQERMDAALHVLKGPSAERERLRRSVLAVIADLPRQQLKDEVMREVGEPAGRPSRGSLREWLIGRWPPLLWGGLAAACAVVLLVVWPDRRQDNSVATVAPPQPAPTAAMPRDPILWPFAADSPWNTPIGSDAVFEDVLPAGVDLKTGAYITDSRETHPLFVVRAEDPVGNIFVGDAAAPFATMKIPRDALLETQPRVAMHLVQEDGFTVIELSEAASPNGKDLRAPSARRADLRGSGIPFEFQSANASGLSPLAGTIRQGELTGGIRHALGAVVPLEAMSIRPDGSGHVWPAGWSPNNPAWSRRFSRTGNVYFGSLLAIPPSVDLATLGLATNSVAYEIARALQDYGAYVKDVFTPEFFPEWQRAGAPHLVFCADLDWEETPPDFRAQLARVVRELKLVTNNGPQSIGGGGTPRRPPAPDFTPFSENSPP